MFFRSQIQSRPWQWVSRLDRFDLGITLLLILSYLGVALLPFAPNKFGDLEFHDEAKAISLAIHGAAPWTQVAIARAPAPTLYYTIPYLFVPPGSDENTYWLAAFLWTIAWMVGALLLLRRTGEILAGPVGGKIVALLSLLSPFAVYYSYGILAETPAYLGAVLFTYGWARWRAAPDRRLLFSPGWGAVVVGLAIFVLSRPNAVLLLLVALLAGIRLYYSGNPERRRAGKFTLAIVLLVGMIVAGASVAVRLLPGNPTDNPQVAYLAHVVFHGRFQFRTEPWDWRFWGKATRVGSVDYANWTHAEADLEQQSATTGIALATLQGNWILNDILTHPGLTLQMTALRFLALHVTLANSQKPEAFRLGPLQGRIGYLLFHLAVNIDNFLLIVTALWFLMRYRRDGATYWFLWGPWLALLLFHVVTYAEPRYLFPSRVGFLIMAAMIITPLWQKIQVRLHKGRMLKMGLKSGGFPPF